MSDLGPVLVTGASGFIGRRLMDVLRRRGYQPVAASGRLEHVLAADPGIPRVIHLAGRSHVPESWRDPLAFYQTNVVGTLRVLEYCRANAARLVHVSSYVYGHPRHLPISEDHPTRATTPYAHSKLLAEECCRFHAETFGLSIGVVRPFNVYGPEQKEPFLIPYLIRQLLDPKQEVVSVADLEPRRDYLFIDDFVELLVAMLESDFTGTVNAGSGRSYSVADIYRLIATAAGGPVKKLVSRGERREGEILDVVADIRHAAAALGWTPAVDLTAGIQRTVEWHRAPTSPNTRRPRH